MSEKMESKFLNLMSWSNVVKKSRVKGIFENNPTGFVKEHKLESDVMSLAESKQNMKVFDQSIEKEKAYSQALRELTSRLARIGYSEYYGCFHPLFPRFEKWKSNRINVTKQLQALVDLFLLGNPVEKSFLMDYIGDLMEPLSALGLILYKGDYIITPDLVLLPVLGNWLFAEKPRINPNVYFGDDSLALLTRLQPNKSGKCLDLCAGTAIQSLFCSNFASEVDAVEINPTAASLAYINVVMNGREQTIKVHCGDLFSPVCGQRFDTIVANPPLLPIPEKVDYPFVGHGGKNGMDITWRILQGIPTFLIDTGTSQIIGTCLSDGKTILQFDEMKDWSRQNRMDTLMTITSHHELKPGRLFFDALVSTASTATSENMDMATVESAFCQSFAEQGATHLCPYYLHITSGTGLFQYQNLAADPNNSFWYI